MILDSSIKLEAVLDGAVTANQPFSHVVFVEYNAQSQVTRPGMTRIALNSASDVTIAASPTRNDIREVTYISIYNKDTANVGLTVKTDDGTTEGILIKVTLLPTETLTWSLSRGWVVAR